MDFMRLIRPFQIGGLAALAVCLFTPICDGAEQSPARPSYSRESVDRDECEQHLNLISSALQEYRRRNQKLPLWLSDLWPDFISEPKTLKCPYVTKTGNEKKWKEGLSVFRVFNDPGYPGSTYGYEFCNERIQNRPEKTCREYKQRQLEVIGFGVPIVRCFAHRPVLNLSFDGQIYQSAKEWEESFTTTPRYEAVFHSVSVMMTESLNTMVSKMIQPRDPKAGARLLDLSTQYNASLLHLSRLDYTGKLQPTYPEG